MFMSLALRRGGGAADISAVASHNGRHMAAVSVSKTGRNSAAALNIGCGPAHTVEHEHSKQVALDPRIGAATYAAELVESVSASDSMTAAATMREIVAPAARRRIH